MLDVYKECYSKERMIKAASRWSIFFKWKDTVAEVAVTLNKGNLLSRIIKSSPQIFLLPIHIQSDTHSIFIVAPAGTSRIGYERL